MNWSRLTDAQLAVLLHYVAGGRRDRGLRSDCGMLLVCRRLSSHQLLDDRFEVWALTEARWVPASEWASAEHACAAALRLRTAWLTRTRAGRA